MWVKKRGNLRYLITEASVQQMQCLPVWLEGDFVISSDLTKIFFQLLKELLIALCLIQRHKGVDVSELLPSDWLSMSGEEEKKKKKVFMNELAQWGSIKWSEQRNSINWPFGKAMACTFQSIWGTWSWWRHTFLYSSQTQPWQRHQGYPRLFWLMQNKHDSPWVQTSCSASLCRIPAFNNTFSGTFT